MLSRSQALTSYDTTIVGVIEKKLTTTHKETNDDLRLIGFGGWMF